MPYVNLKLIGRLSKEQKAQIVAEFSDTLARVAGIPREAVDAHFPDGMRGAVAASDPDTGSSANAKLTGSEATRILESLLEASE